MYIKLYIHPDKLINLRNHDSVLAKQMPNSQYEIEIFVNIEEYNISNQQNGVLIQKKKSIKNIFKRK